MNLNQLRQFYIFFLKGINKCLFPLGGKRQLSHLSSANLHWFRDSALGSQILLTGTIIRYQRETTGGKREQSLKQTPPHSQTEGGGAPLASLRASRSAPRWWLWLLLSVEMRNVQAVRDPTGFYNRNMSARIGTLDKETFWATQLLLRAIFGL